MGQPAQPMDPQSLIQQAMQKIQELEANPDPNDPHKVDRLRANVMRAQHALGAQQGPANPPDMDSTLQPQPPNPPPAGADVPPQPWEQGGPNAPGTIQMETQNIQGQVPQQPPDVLGQTLFEMPKDDVTSIAMKSVMEGFKFNEEPEDWSTMTTEEKKARVLEAEALDRQRGIDAQRYPDSKSHKAAIYAPPVVDEQVRSVDAAPPLDPWNPMNWGKLSGDSPTWIHMEPTQDQYKSVLEAIRDWQPDGTETPKILQTRRDAKAGAEASLAALDDHGDDDEGLREFQDAIWQQVYKTAQSVGQRAIRMEFAPEDSDDPEVQKARAMRTFGPAATNAFDTATFGLGVPFMAWYNKDMEDSPLGKALKEKGLYAGELGEYQKLKQAGGWSQELIGNMLGMITPGAPAPMLYGAIGKYAAKGAGTAESRQVVPRLLKGAALGGGTDFTTGTARTIAEQLVAGRDVNLSEAAQTGLSEGLYGAAGSTVLGGLGELGSSVVQRMRASSEGEINALEQGLGGKSRGVGDTGERLTNESFGIPDEIGIPGTGRKIGVRFGKDLSEDNIVGNAVRRAGSNEEVITIPEAAGQYAAKKVAPTLRKNTRKVMETIAANEAAFYSDPIAEEAMPITGTFNALRKFVDNTTDASQSVRRSAGKALGDFSEFKAYTDRSVAVANSAGGYVVRMDDPIVREMGWTESVQNARDTLAKKALKNPGAPMRRPPKNRTWIVLSPKEMKPAALAESLNDLYSKINFNSGEAKESVKLAAEALKKDRKQWPGFDEMFTKNHELISQLEGAGRLLGGSSFREMAGHNVPENFLNTINDMQQADLARYLTNVYQPGKSGDTEQLVRLLDNPHLERLLKGLRAAIAWDRLNGGKSYSAHAAASSGGVRAVVNFGRLDRWLYGTNRGLERMYLSGTMPKAARVLFEPDTKDFIETVDGNTIKDLLKALNDKEEQQQ